MHLWNDENCQKKKIAPDITVRFFPQFVVLFENLCFESVRCQELLINKTICKSLFLLSEKNTSICVWFIKRSQCDGELYDFIAAAKRDHINVVCSYSGFAQFCTVLYVIFYYMCSIKSLCILSTCQCHCLNYILIIFVTSKGNFFCGWLNLERTLKHFMIHKSDDSCVSLVACGSETEGGRGRVVWTLVSMWWKRLSMLERSQRSTRPVKVSPS